MSKKFAELHTWFAELLNLQILHLAEFIPPCGTRLSVAHAFKEHHSRTHKASLLLAPPSTKFWQCCPRLGSLQRLEIRQSLIYYAGSLGRWDKWIVDQASDVPSIIFFPNFLQNSLQKLFQFIFLFLVPKSLQKLWKKIMLGTSDAWLISRLSHRPIEPAYWRLTDF